MGYLFALLAALLFGTNGSVTKVIIDAGVTPAQLTFFRVVTVFAIAGVWLLIGNRAAFRITRRQVVVMALLGVAGVALLQWTYAVAISLLPVGIALLLEYLAVLAVARHRQGVLPRAGEGPTLARDRTRARRAGLVAQVGAGGDLSVVGVAVRPGRSRHPDAVLPRRRAPGGRDVADRRRVLVDGLRRGVLGVLQRLVGVRPGLFAAPVSLGGTLDSVVVPLWALARVERCARLVRAVPALLPRPEAPPGDRGGHRSSSEVLFAFAVAWLWLGEGLGPLQLVGAALVLVAIVLAQTARAQAPSTRTSPRSPWRPESRSPDPGVVARPPSRRARS